MKCVSKSPIENSGVAMMRWCNGIEVWIPSTTNRSSALCMRVIASVLSFPCTISFATNEFYKPTISRLAAALPMIDDHGPLAVDGEMNGHDIVLILDSAAPFAISDASYPLTQITSLRIGDLHLTDLTNNRAMAKTLGGESFPRVGLPVLSRFILTLDNRAGKIYLELPEEGA